MVDPDKQNLQILYKDVSAELARCGQRQIDFDKVQDVLAQVIQQMALGREAASFVVRPVKDFERIETFLKSQDDQPSIFCDYQRLN